jgi:fructokinase
MKSMAAGGARPAARRTGDDVGMIAVAGEALIDLVVGTDGRVDARPGGGPYNAARTLARLGQPVTFLGRLAADGFGRLLRERLTAEDVALGIPEPSARPSTLAVATLDEAGVADYAFYLDGTAAADVGDAVLRAALPGAVTAVHVGTLGLLMEPIGTAIERLVRSGVPADALVLLDPNCRPAAVTDEGAYRARIAAIAQRADIVKASVEDLAYLYPGLPPEAAAKLLLAAGPELVLVTDGPHPARAFLPDVVLAAEVPPVTVADTIGAGDAFGGGFLGWWTARGLGRDDLRSVGQHGVGQHGAGQHGAGPRRDELVGQALRAAAAVAALTCARPGADPPSLAEVRDRNWWP